MSDLLHVFLKHFPDNISELKPLNEDQPWYLKVSNNGEICYNTLDKTFTVWDETYAFEVGSTTYPLVAYSMLNSYAENYL